MIEQAIICYGRLSAESKHSRFTRGAMMRPDEPSQVNAIQLYRPVCSRCGSLTMLVRIEPADKPDHDMRTFECWCGHAEIVELKYR